MRLIFALPLLLAACSQESQPPVKLDPDAGLFAGAGRDRYCIKRSGDDWHVGIVTYGTGDMNCTLKGRVVGAEDHGSLVQATGDPSCQFYVESDGETLRLPARLPEACAYYCAPGADLAGKTFKRDLNASPAVDFAGDPLC